MCSRFLAEYISSLANTRRCITLMYATIGLILVTFSETVKRAKARHKAGASDPVAQPTPDGEAALSAPGEAA